ncbi:hypothetical protein EV143_106143 [Flavobacterium chryseum]|uniref:hypothetical protein n=1 Tax=Flavobacterium sp. P3160 TaxID=2512113 RepID=UPI001061FF13|nr:hypothetical protein [Flavobacterium sp. P3160]TDO73201.1 hypothetical protein EV143_106143 [Flavobacterium sp. P3160]
MENVNNIISPNYGKCLHSAISTEENSEFTYRKAYVGDWGDWDDQPDNNTVSEGSYELEELI